MTALYMITKKLKWKLKVIFIKYEVSTTKAPPQEPKLLILSAKFVTILKAIRLWAVKNTKPRTVMRPHRQSKLNLLKWQISLSQTVKLQALANACQNHGKTLGRQTFQEGQYDEFPRMSQEVIKVWTPITDFRKLYPQILAWTHPQMPVPEGTCVGILSCKQCFSSPAVLTHS